MTEGRQLAEAGMQQTLAFEPEDWITDALNALREFAADPFWREFKTEDFRAWYGRKPHDHHVWGALTNRACREGIIQWTGRYAPSVSPRTHGHPVKVWSTPRLSHFHPAPVDAVSDASGAMGRTGLT